MSLQCPEEKDRKINLVFGHIEFQVPLGSLGESLDPHSSGETHEVFQEVHLLNLFFSLLILSAEIHALSIIYVRYGSSCLVHSDANFCFSQPSVKLFLWLLIYKPLMRFWLREM